MIIIVSLIFSVIVMLFFGSIRLLASKNKEFVQFIVMYLFSLLFMFCLSYIIVRTITGDNWHLHFHPIREQLYVALFYIPPTFLISYLLYPFTIIKRNRILIWILLGYSIIILGGSALLNILVSFSNM